MLTVSPFHSYLWAHSACVYAFGAQNGHLVSLKLGAKENNQHNSVYVVYMHRRYYNENHLNAGEYIWLWNC